MAQSSIPAAEIGITQALVRALLVEQHPDLADLSISEIASGWDNALFRIGDFLVVRLPRRAIAVPLVEHEHRWLPQLAQRLPLPIPVARRMGRPGCGYPWPWSVLEWIEGETAVRSVPIRNAEIAHSLGAFLRALHVPAPTDAPTNTVRGVALAARTPRMLGYVDAVRDMVDAKKILAGWERAIAVPGWLGPKVWLHGDLHPANVILSKGRIAAVIDFGDLTSGDPATDLAAAWMLFSPEVRGVFRQAADSPARPIDDHMWMRARAWALTMNVGWLSMSANDAETTAMTQAAIAAVLADE